ncbi:MAG: hypothetical protein HKN23_08170 [Verrucomicrobiales bacterium]|nr:hypothetical protein [Verrucomicrobiales bacterium]
MAGIAILTDIHGNLPALEAVLREVADCGAEQIAFGGDLVGYGASPAECVALVRNLGGHCVLGNHDAMTMEVHDRGIEHVPATWKHNPVWAGVIHAVKHLSEEDLKWLWDLPWFLRMQGGVIAHASLSDPNSWQYLSDQAAAVPTLNVLKEKRVLGGIGFFGHTHQFRVFSEEETADAKVAERLDEDRYYFPEGCVSAVTIASVGQPRDPGDYRACWAIWDPEDRVVTFKRTDYPAILAARNILDAGLPPENAARLLRGADL